MSEFREQLESFFGKGIAKVIIAIVVLILIYIIISAVFSFWPFSSVAGVIQKVTSSTAIISNYEWFYDQYNAIKATRAKLAIAERRGMEEAAGIAMVLESMIGEYNAHSKQITRNLWKASDLPYQINTEAFE